MFRLVIGQCGRESFFFFNKVFGGHVFFLGPLVPLFWICGDVSSGFQRQSGFCLIHFFPLVLHVPTSWQPKAQPFTASHASAEMGLDSDLNGQSPRQKMNALPLCQRPGRGGKGGRESYLMDRNTPGME